MTDSPGAISSSQTVAFCKAYNCSLTFQKTPCHPLLPSLQFSHQFSPSSTSLTLPYFVSIINILVLPTPEASLPWDLISPAVPANYNVPCTSDNANVSASPDREVIESYPCTIQNESPTLARHRGFETGAISSDKAVGNPRGFLVIKTGTGVCRLQTRESAVTGSAWLATDCSLDTRRLD